MRTRVEAKPLALALAIALAPGCGSTTHDPVVRVAHVLDAFEGTAIDTTRWTVVNSQPGPGPFTVSDGRLHFAYNAGGGGIWSTETATPGFYSARFFDFTSSNCETPGSHKGAFGGLGLGPKENFVQVMRDQNGTLASDGSCRRTSVFEVLYVDPSVGGDGIRSIWSGTPPTVTSGRLGLFFDGTFVTFYFSPDPYSDTSWQTMKVPGGGVLQWAPGWTAAPAVFVRGWDPAGTTSFSVDDVAYTPDPPTAL